MKDEVLRRLTKEEKDKVYELLLLYFELNPHVPTYIGFRGKTNDTIKSYYVRFNKSFEEIETCIRHNEGNDKPIWDVFYSYFFKKKKKSEYKDIEGSTDVDKWI